jgi:hypothetical protein
MRAGLLGSLHGHRLDAACFPGGSRKQACQLWVKHDLHKVESFGGHINATSTPHQPANECFAPSLLPNVAENGPMQAWKMRKIKDLACK